MRRATSFTGQCVGGFRPFPRRIVLLADVLTPGVQLQTSVLQELDQFADARAHRAIGRAALVITMRTRPNGRLPHERPGRSTQYRRKADPVDVPFGLKGRPARFNSVR
jgi:hypothetical protein